MDRSADLPGVGNVLAHSLGNPLTDLPIDGLQERHFYCITPVKVMYLNVTRGDLVALGDVLVRQLLEILVDPGVCLVVDTAVRPVLLAHVGEALPLELGPAVSHRDVLGRATGAPTGRLTLDSGFLTYLQADLTWWVSQNSLLIVWHTGLLAYLARSHVKHFSRPEPPTCTCARKPCSTSAPAPCSSLVQPYLKKHLVLEILPPSSPQH